MPERFSDFQKKVHVEQGFDHQVEVAADKLKTSLATRSLFEKSLNNFEFNQASSIRKRYKIQDKQIKNKKKIRIRLYQINLTNNGFQKFELVRLGFGSVKWHISPSSLLLNSFTCFRGWCNSLSIMQSLTFQAWSWADNRFWRVSYFMNSHNVMNIMSCYGLLNYLEKQTCHDGN